MLILLFGVYAAWTTKGGVQQHEKGVREVQARIREFPY